MTSPVDFGYAVVFVADWSRIAAKHHAGRSLDDAAADPRDYDAAALVPIDVARAASGEDVDPALFWRLQNDASSHARGWAGDFGPPLLSGRGMTGFRSVSVGDVVRLGAASWFRCAPMGWARLDPSAQAAFEQEFVQHVTPAATAGDVHEHFQLAEHQRREQREAAESARAADRVVAVPASRSAGGFALVLVADRSRMVRERRDPQVLDGFVADPMDYDAAAVVPLAMARGADGAVSHALLSRLQNDESTNERGWAGDFGPTPQGPHAEQGFRSVTVGDVVRLGPSEWFRCAADGWERLGPVVALTFEREFGRHVAPPSSRDPRVVASEALGALATPTERFAAASVARRAERTAAHTTFLTADAARREQRAVTVPDFPGETL